MTEANANATPEQTASADLKLLKQAVISIDQYLERRLVVAVQRLGSAITEEQRSEIHSLLRDHFLDDPALRIYAERAKQADDRQ